MENVKFRNGVLTPNHNAFDVEGEISGKKVRLSRFG